METKKIIEKILNIIRYPLEFLLVTMLMIIAYKFITIKAYEGYWSGKILVYLTIVGIATASIIIFNIIKDKDKIERMFVNFVIPIGIMYIVFMLPTYTPDAGAHLWRSYEMSNGIFFTKIDEEGKSLTTVPEVMSTYRETKLTKYSVMNEVLGLEESNDYSKTVELDTPAKGYSLIFYLFYALGLAIGRIFSLNIFISILLARLINFAAFILIGYFAIKKIPFGKVLLATYLMIPMMMQQATAISVDSIMNALIALFVAYTLNLSFKEEQITKKEKIIYLVMTFIIGITKITYIPIIGIGLILAKRRKDISNKQKIILGIATVLLCFISYIGLSMINSNYSGNSTANRYLEEAGVNSSAQINGIITNPGRYLYMLFYNFICQGEAYLYNCIGNHMGWLTITMPIIYIVFYIILLLFSAFVENNEKVLDKIEKAWMIILATIMAILVVTGLYIEWTGVGQMLVAGVQGRYFLPIIILPLLCLSLKNNYIKLKYVNVFIPLCSLLINSLFITQIIRFFI